MDYKKLFNDANILDSNTNIPGEYVWYPYGWKIRNLYVGYIRNELEKLFYEEWHFTDFLGKKGVEKMHNNIMSIKKKLYPINQVASNGSKTQNYYLAPTHEISVFEAMSRYIKNSYDLPLRFFHIGSAFRKQYNSNFPFGLSKRNTYIECYDVQDTKEKLYNQLDYILLINRKILGKFLILPFIESFRPISTNNPVSKKTIGMDILTPMNKTLHAGMIYIQEDIFSKIFGVEYYDKNSKTNINPYAIHYGFTDNLLMSSIIHGFNLGAGKKIVLPHGLMPYHISITNINNDYSKFFKLFGMLDLNGYRYELVKSFPFGNPKNKTIIKKINIQNPYLHIKGMDENGMYIYRKLGENLWIKGDEKNIIETIDNIRVKRENYMKSIKKKILENKIIEVSNLLDINVLISKGFIIDVYLQNEEDTILSMEKIIYGGEILGFRENNLSGNCIFTGVTTKTKAYLSKRI